MKKSLHRLSHSLKTGGLIRTLSRARLYRAVCERYGLVYFGTVAGSDDDYAMVRGLTVSAQAVDRHYCVGSVDNFDVILLERSDQLYFPYKKPESYRWAILQVDINHVTLPHAFLDAHQHQAVFYDSFSAKYPYLRKNDAGLFSDHHNKFSQIFSTYSALQDIESLQRYLSPAITNTLAYHFYHYDFELLDDKLLVYSSSQVPSMNTFDNLFRAGIWLAGELEKSSQSDITTHDSIAPQTR